MPDDPRDLWQHQDLDRVSFTVEEIRRRAERLHKRVHSRNLREYLVGIVMVAFFGWGVWRHQGAQRLSDALLVAAILFVMDQLHRRASSLGTPADAGLRTSLASYRAELMHQRDALRSVWLWYEMPFIPGMAVRLWDIGAHVGTGVKYFVGVGWIAAVFIGIGALNWASARRLDRRTRELEKLENNNE